jgi:LPXTG-motif cell wall-anchored protein
MKQNKTLFIVGGALLVAGAAYLFFRNKGKQDQAALDRLGIPPADETAAAILPAATGATAGAAAGAGAGIGKKTTGGKAAGAGKLFGKLTG